jgi:hypothetical protein
MVSIKIKGLPILALMGLAMSGCTAMAPQPVQPQPPQRETPAVAERGAVAGVAQRVGFFYAVGGDCAFTGLVQMSIAQSPSHGSVSFVQMYAFPDYAQNNVRFVCNRRKTLG